ncbi:homoserine O-succinyltransferase [Saccharothrix ecbatanensis]|uniref:Homoserine O-succinyltransferase n=1 Tax=Saccharothrix ecbatanensis TaxID=1105145 RepID=A0A7W9M100_9PSEU|nr:homoserine O-succinyltransferase [Saccharothrix ecbatanensis]MBB5803455.1 homoserine O-succinyltransferase [Saccharothrix ecbatanensis]
MTSHLPRPHLPHVRPAALHQPPRIGIANLMPHAEQFAGMLLPQFAAAAPFEPVMIRMRDRRYSLDSPQYIERLYVPIEDAGELDAIIITGAAVEHLPFSEVRYLDEIADMIRPLAERDVPVLGLCWGALAVGHLLLGLSSAIYEQKVSGAYETDLLVGDHVIGKGLDDRFWTAHSRYAGFDESTVDTAVVEGRLRVLARAGSPADTVIAESVDHTALMHIGHPEYEGSRLADEYKRDVGKGLPNVLPPANVDLGQPVCQWRSASRVFFANWVELVYERAIARQSHASAAVGG